MCVSYEETTVTGYKFYREMYRDCVTIVHCMLVMCVRRTDISLGHGSEDADLRERAVDVLR